MVYKYIDIVGVSSEGITEAVKDAADEAAEVSQEFKVGRDRKNNPKNRRSKDTKSTNQRN